MPDRTPLEIIIEGKQIIVRGDLTSDPQVHRYIDRTLSPLSGQRAKCFVIDASKTCVLKGGVETWASAVNDCLAKHELNYKASQLGMALYYYPGYKHPKSYFASADRNHVA